MIGFVGMSHLGLVSAIGVAAKGFDVVGFDPAADLIRALNESKLPVFEPDLDALLEANRSRMSFSSEVSALGKCDVVYVALDVKTDDQGASDLTALNALISRVIPALKPQATLVILSQVPPGFTRTLARAGLTLYYQVETLIFGRAVERTLHPERYMVGCADPSEILPLPFQRLLEAFDCPILKMRYESAELAKISINFFLVSSVSTTNTLAELCEQVGADWAEIAPSLRLDKRIGPHAYLGPGLGIAGGNLERDLATVRRLAHRYGTDCGIVDAWTQNSRYRRDWALRTVQTQVLSGNPGAVLAVWGLAYKQDTKSTKNSPSLALVKSLKGVSLRAYDPQVVLGVEEAQFGLKQVGSVEDASQGADAIVIMTPWAEFSRANLSACLSLMRGKILIDPYGVLKREQALTAGFDYRTLGVSL